MPATKQSRIKKAYLNISEAGGFSSASKLFKALHSKPENGDINKSDVQKWLQGVESYTMNKFSRRHTKATRGNKVPADKIGFMWDCDLMFMTNNSESNNGFKYILIVIDIFSKYLYTEPLKTKNGTEMVQAFRKILKNTNPPEHLRTDGGSEFRSVTISKLYRELNIEHYVTQSEHKAYFAERVIGTLRTTLARYMVYHNTHKWVDVLPDLTANYNATYHSTIRMSPKDVTKDNEQQVWANQTLMPVIEKRQAEQKKEAKILEKVVKKQEDPKPNTSKKKLPVYKFKVGDYVRISYKRRAFEKIHDQKFSGEIFKIAKRYRRDGRPVYRLEDLMGELLSGPFYHHELQKIKYNKNQYFKIDPEKTVTKTVRGKKMYYVKWLYYPKKFNEWVSAKQMKVLNKNATPNTK